jgi:hypothetical protein
MKAEKFRQQIVKKLDAPLSFSIKRDRHADSPAIVVPVSPSTDLATILAENILIKRS